MRIKTYFMLFGRPYRGPRQDRIVCHRRAEHSPLFSTFLIGFFILTGLGATSSAEAAQLTVNFQDLSGVHIEVLTTDGVIGVASGKKVTQKKWRSNKTTLEVPAGRYDLNIKKGASSYIVDDVDCTSAVCTVNGITATLNVKFPGLSLVHTSVQVTDGSDGTTSGKEVAYSNWRSNETEIKVLRQIYDLKIDKGSATHIIDNVDCTSGICTVDGIATTMTVKFPGLTNVATTVHLPDDIEQEVSGNEFTRTSWKHEEAIITVLPQVYDLKIQKGAAALIVDNVDCTSGTCTVEGVAATMTVNFPGLSGVHTTAKLSDSIAGVASGNEFTYDTWEEDQAIITVFPLVYDLKLEHGSATHFVDDVDCTSGNCTVDGLVATMALQFPGLTSVHTSVRHPDGINNRASGKEVAISGWKTDETIIPVFPQVYDLEIQKGSAIHVIDNVDCTSGTCEITELTAIMTVNFPGLSSVHSTVLVPDGVDGTVFGEEVTHINWQENQAVMKVLPEVYDLKIVKGAATIIVDNVDCSSGTCTVDDLTALLTVDFPGLSGVNTKVLVPDGINGTASGGELTHANWKAQKAIIPVFRQTYDVTVEHDTLNIYDNLDCTSGNCNLMIQGNVQATLIDGDNNVPLAGIKIRAYEKLPDGSLSSTQRREANENGKAHFSLEGVGSSKTYVLRVDNPFGNEKRYYSPFISDEGPFEFRITREGTYPLDLIPPQISIITPENGGGVSVNGFEIKGDATDDNQIESVIITIDDPVQGRTIISAEYTEKSHAWSAKITSSSISESAGITVTATSLDRAHNETSESITVSGIVDKVGPQISITSHEANDTVAVTGFLLSGQVTDETMVKSIFATVIDPTKGTTLNNRQLELSPNSGTWTLVVLNGLITEGNTITVNLTATDIENNSSSTMIPLRVVAVNNLARHMINRMTFGATPELLTEVKTLGASEFLNQQLDPASIDNSEFESLITNFQPTSEDELKVFSMLHMIYSRCQLNEVMTWFWDNHFSTDINKEGNQVSYELNENQQFRANALGNFRELLGLSAKSPAMLYYLDSVLNSATDSNENYAREILELHTMGVDGGYGAADIEAGAEIFTGWNVQNGNFFFNSEMHNFDSQFFLGEEIPSGGIEQGEQLMDIAVAHRATAEFICKKLVMLFVNDTPPESLVQRAADIFQIALNDGDQMAQVVREILTSPEFNESYREKVKSPLELVVGFARNLSATTNGNDLHLALESMGMILFENSLPTGWSETGDDWINSNLLLERIKWVNQVALYANGNDDTFIDPVNFFKANDFETAEGIVGFLIELVIGDDVSDLERHTALDILNSEEPFLLAAADSDEKLRLLIGTVLSYPAYQYQ